MNPLYNSPMARTLTKPRPRQGELLRQFRLAAGLSQRELAGLIGETQQNVAFWEQSDKPPRSDVLPRLAQALGVRVEDLLQPRRQQDKVVEFVSAFVCQYRQGQKE